MTIGGSVASNAAVKARFEWMDLLRGVAIILVVLFHAETVIRNDTVPPGWLSTWNEIFSPLRMPVMVFLSGLLVPRSIAKGTKNYIAGKARKVAWPYLVWSLLMLGLFIASSSITGDKWSVADAGRVLHDPIEHMWFLYYLLGYYAVALLTVRWSAAAVAGAYLLTAGAASLLGWTDLRIFAFLGIFFMAGVAFAKSPAALENVLAATASKVLAVAGFAGLVVMALFLGQVRYEVMIIPAVGLSLLGALIIARRVRPARCNAALRFVGQNSLIFYLAHYPAIIVAAALAERFTDKVPLVLALELVAGLAAGWLAVLLTRAIPATKLLFELPTPGNRGSRTPARPSHAARSHAQG